MPVEPPKVIKMVFKCGASFDFLTRMSEHEIVKQIEGRSPDNDPDWIKLSGLTVRDEITPFACLREQFFCYTIVPFHPSEQSQQRAGVPRILQ